MEISTLILNPTENFVMNIDNNFDLLEGYYVSNESRSKDDKIIFADRSKYADTINNLKRDWCATLGASDIDFRFLSGLHAHIITFMSIGNIGDTVLLLPETAGGHYSTEAILKRLGYNVISAVSDNRNFCIDVSKTIDLIKNEKPKFAFIDRSEGLYYENFSWIKDAKIPYCIFDASQYLSQILSGIYPLPFEEGFDLILASTHKNYPGPQKAFLATKKKDFVWENLKHGSSTYISNSHPKDLMRTMSTISKINEIKSYSELMIKVSDTFQKELKKVGFPVIEKVTTLPHTQHIWAHFQDTDECYKVYSDLANLGLLTNYRLLPYDLGYGLRIGVGAAIQQGLRLDHIQELANIFYKCYKFGYSESLFNESQSLINFVCKTGKYI